MNEYLKHFTAVSIAVVAILGFNFITEKTVEPNLNLDANKTEVQSAADRPVNSFKDFNDAIIEIAEKANPAVVTITTERTQEVSVRDPLSEFFGFRSQPQQREYTQRGLGSGVIVDESGYILTNNHVIEGADEIKIIMLDGEEMSAKVIGTDPQTDIAVVKVDRKGLPALALGNSEDLKVGSFVLAIGSPLSQNLNHTVSFGIVSAKNRSIDILQDVGGFEEFIQTDAAINPGNSGGALIDMNGELVGINSAIASRSGGNEGIGFAIPISLAKRIMDDLIEDGSVTRGYLGLYFGGEVDQTMARALGLSNAGGIIISEVEEGGPADKSGLKGNDVILSLNGEKVKNWVSFRNQIARLRPNDKVEIEYVRNGKKSSTKVELGTRNIESIASVDAPTSGLREKLGFDVLDLNSSVRSQLNLESSVDGVIVSTISESSNAYRRDLRRGDLITSINNKEITNKEEFFEELENAEKSEVEVILLTVERNNVKQFIAFEL